MAKEKLEAYHAKRISSKNFYSKQGLDLFEKIVNNYQTGRTLYSPKTPVFGKYVHSLGRYCRYDFCDIDNKIIIEYNGDCWHGNPEIYKPNDICGHKSSGMISAKKWEDDYKKCKWVEDMGFLVIVVWERDWIGNPIETLEKVIESINKKIRND